ncbi:3381_t:CDS:2 [Paraglomus occultum]|uniref:Palmitoyltransferase n=1 Tax=Paraglomus occultum TaxID=144539 RepID=A0A9N8ZCV5_9GLOM|nr:3381_t:CDS:2 [Paraglomus occultum]
MLSLKPSVLFSLDKIASRAIAIAGPVFILIAVVLISLAVITYYSVVFPYAFVWDKDYIWSKVNYYLGLIWSIYLTVCIAFHYYMSITTKPGGILIGGTGDPNDDPVLHDIFVELEEYQEFPKTCKKCHLPKPERAHHCSVCKRCVLRFDHHCPWIANCVGHYNHRYFLLFMTYLTIACAYFTILGWQPFLLSLEFDSEWEWWMPRPYVALTFLLAVSIGVALGGMCLWHYYLVVSAQTTVEFYNNRYAKSEAKRRGEAFVNPYSFGIVNNFKQFFNVGSNYPIYTIFLPIPIPPSGNGKVWQKNATQRYSTVQVDEYSEDDE